MTVEEIRRGGTARRHRRRADASPRGVPTMSEQPDRASCEYPRRASSIGVSLPGPDDRADRDALRGRDAGRRTEGRMVTRDHRPRRVRRDRAPREPGPRQPRPRRDAAPSAAPSRSTRPRGGPGRRAHGSRRPRSATRRSTLADDGVPGRVGRASCRCPAASSGRPATACRIRKALARPHRAGPRARLRGRPGARRPPAPRRPPASRPPTPNLDQVRAWQLEERTPADAV